MEIKRERCVNTGNWIQMCDVLSEVTRNEYGDIQVRTMRRRDIDSRRLEIVAGRLKNNRVALNFCPFCGVDIRTEHKEPNND